MHINLQINCKTRRIQPTETHNPRTSHTQRLTWGDASSVPLGSPDPSSPPPQAFLSVLDQCPKIEVDMPLVKSYLAQFAARAVMGELVSMAELAHPL